MYFTGVVQLFVEQTNLYYRQYCDSVDDGPSSPFPVDDLTMSDVLMLLAVTLQMGHDVRDTLKYYWSTLEQLHTLFYSNAMKRTRYFHILRFLHFSDNNNKPDKTHQNYDRLWKLRTVFDMFSEAFGKSEHLAVDEVIVKFKGRVIFKHSIPSKRKRFWIKMYKTSDTTGYTYDMRVYLGKEAHTATKEMTATHVTVRNLTRRVEGDIASTGQEKGTFSGAIVCSARAVLKRLKYHCVQCKVGLCVYPCFHDYHTKLNL
jgi:hypothetical protein